MSSKCINSLLLRGSFIVGAVILMAGCSWFSDDEKLKEAETLPPLEVPPDLIRPYSEDKTVKPVLPQNTKAVKDCQCDDRPPKIGEAVLPAGKGVKKFKDGPYRWLLVAAEPEQIWPLARKFLEMRGYQISRDEPVVGLMETAWKERFEGRDGNMVSDSRERLRIRMEPGQQADSTEIYISQYLSERVKSTHESGAENGNCVIQTMSVLLKC